jgi:fermentation-respiration switch protein FrsA (DUF1100 family)
VSEGALMMRDVVRFDELEMRGVGKCALHRQEFRIDVTGAVEGIDERLEIAGTLFVPDGAADHKVVMSLLPGGSYTQKYWDLQGPGDATYSFVDYAIGHHCIVLTFDELGQGMSSKPSAYDSVTLEAMAEAQQQAVTRLRGAIRSGRAELLPLQGLPWVGIGHSLGGSATVIQQGKYGAYDAIGILGASLLGTAPVRPGDPGQNDVRSETLEAARAAAIARQRLSFGDRWDEGYVSPSEVEAFPPLDATTRTAVPRMAAVDALGSRVCLPYAAQVKAPVFVCFGNAGDTSVSPHTEVSLFVESNDVTLYVLQGSGHMHNASPVRADLWERLLRWLESLFR